MQIVFVLVLIGCFWFWLYGGGWLNGCVYVLLLVELFVLVLCWALFMLLRCLLFLIGELDFVGVRY